VIDEATEAGALASMHRGRDPRASASNLATSGENDPKFAARTSSAAAERVAAAGLGTCRVYTGLDVITALADDLMKLPVPIRLRPFRRRPGRRRGPRSSRAGRSC